MELLFEKIIMTYELIPFRTSSLVFGCGRCQRFIGLASDCINVDAESAWIRPLHSSHVFPVDDSNYIRCVCGALLGYNEGGLYHIGSIMLTRIPYDTSRAFGLMPRFIRPPDFDLIICNNPGCNRFYGLNSMFVRAVENNIIFPSFLASNMVMVHDYARLLRCVCGNRIGSLIDGNCVRLHTYAIVGIDDPRLREIIVPRGYDLFQNDDEDDMFHFIDPDSDSDSEFEVFIDSGVESDFD